MMPDISCASDTLRVAFCAAMLCYMAPALMILLLLICYVDARLRSARDDIMSRYAIRGASALPPELLTVVAYTTISPPLLLRGYDSLRACRHATLCVTPPFSLF